MTKELGQTESLCPYCLKRITARKIVEDNNVYLEKECPEHGHFKVLIWRDAELYEEWGKFSQHARKVINPNRPFKNGCPFDCGLCPDHEGGTCTAVMEITYKCNMNCPICFAVSSEEQTYEADMDTIEEMYQTVLDNGGPCSVQLSGGEPTVRDDLPEIVKLGKEMGFKHIQVNTNGLRIAKDIEYLYKLKECGADLIYLQFDGMTDDVYRTTRGRGLLDVKIQAIDNCEQIGIGVLLVPTVTPKVNQHQLGEIIKFAKKRMPVVKGVHFQPISYFGRHPFEIPKDGDRTTLSDVVKEIVEQTEGEIKLKDFVPRKRKDAHCAFSSLFVLMEDGSLHAVTEYGKESHEVLQEKMREFNASIDSLKNNREYFAAQANNFTNKHWRMDEDDSKNIKASRWDQFTKRLKDYTLSITGMPFQDVWNIDIQRLKGCCVHVVSNKKQLIPLCAFHVTSVTGERLYKNE